MTCLRQSGIPKDHENEFFTKDIYSQIGLKCLVTLGNKIEIGEIKLIEISWLFTWVMA